MFCLVSVAVGRFTSLFHSRALQRCILFVEFEFGF